MDLLPTLRSLYERAVRNIGKNSEDLKTLANPDERLGGHLVLYYRHGSLEVDDPLLLGFFDAASDDLRYSVLTNAVRGIQDLKDKDLASTCQRLKILWEQRTEETKGRDGTREWSAFSWWFIKDEFDDGWALTELERAFKHGAELELDGQVLERLKNLSSHSPQQVLRCLGLIVKDPRNQRWRIYDNPVKDILRALLRADDPEVRDQAQDLIHFIGSKGLFTFRKLLDEYSAKL